MAVPNTFAAATSAIPLANLDANFAYYDAAYSITGTATSFTGAVTLSTGTANGVPYLNASKVLTSGTALTFDGTILSSTRFAGALNGTVGATTANTGAFTTLTTSSTVTLNGGTANGVTYLNASKVLTSGTALTFDGTNVANTGGVFISKAPGAGFYGQSDVGASTGFLGFNQYTGVTLSSQNTNPIKFEVNSSEQMRLTSTGLGIGTSSPLVNNKLDVRGNIAIGLSTGEFRLYNAAGNNWSTIYSPKTAGDTEVDLKFVTKTGTMTMDSAGNLGLGVVPSAWSAGNKVLQFGTRGLLNCDSNGVSYYGNNFYFDGATFKYIQAAAAAILTQDAGAHKWYRSTSTPVIGNDPVFEQAMTLDASGNLLVGTTSASATNPGCVIARNGSRQTGNSAGPSGWTFDVFQRSGTTIGSITQSGTTAVLYNVTSDQRLKENIVDAPEFGSVIDSIKVRSYDWKTDQTHQRAGFIAQELVVVAPEAVHQPANPEDMMAVDYSKLVPMLVKEIQSLRARVASLESK